MANLEAINLDALFVMLKGEPGTRKSTQALSFPRPQYWISTDQKMESLVLPASRWNIPFSEIDYEDYSDWDKPLAKMRQLQVNVGKYKTIIVDSITSIGDNINRQTLKGKTGTQNKEGDAKGMMVGSIPVNTMQDYKAEASAFQELTAVLKDINKFHKVHVILIAHVVGQRKAEETNNLTHHSRIIVTGGDKISAKIPAYCTEVYHFNVKNSLDADTEGRYQLFTSHTGNDFARSSLPIARQIQFDDRPLFDGWIKPGIDKLKEEQAKNKQQRTTQQQTTTNVSASTKSKFEG